MIILHYQDEAGDVEAEFDTLEEFYKFKEALAAKEQEAAEKEKEALAKEKERELAHKKELEEQWNNIKAGFKEVIDKAKSYGMSPSAVAFLIRETLSDATRAVCIGDCNDRPED